VVWTFNIEDILTWAAAHAKPVSTDPSVYNTKSMRRALASADSENVADKIAKNKICAEKVATQMVLSGCGGEVGGGTVRRPE
jgi:hypothetical protein